MFKIQDLMIDVVAVRGRGGGVMMPTPTEPTPPSPISPIAVVTSFTDRFQVIDRVVQFADKVDVQVLDQVALQIGRAVVAARVAAYCTEEMATCDNNERISPFASAGIAELRAVDFGILQRQVQETVQWMDERGDVLEKRAIENRKELLPRLERAIQYLKEG